MGEILTCKGLASYLNCHVSTIYRLLRKGQLPAFKVGADWRFNQEDIDRWRFNQTSQPSSLLAAQKRKKSAENE